MYFLGALTLFLAAAQAAVTANVLVDKITWFGQHAKFLQSPARVINPMDAILIDHKLGGAYVGPLPLPDRSYPTVPGLQATRAS